MEFLNTGLCESVCSCHWIFWRARTTRACVNEAQFTKNKTILKKSLI